MIFFDSKGKYDVKAVFGVSKQKPGKYVVTVSREDDEAPAAPSAPQPPKGKSDNSSDVTTGRWMVGIGLRIGLLLIIFVNSTKHESPRSTSPSVSQAPAPAVPAYQPPTPATFTPRPQPAQEAVIQRSAATESVNVLGQQIVFSNPSGYCMPSNSAREVELMDLARRSLGEGSRLVHAAIRCSELEDYRKGRRNLLYHWLQIQLISPKLSVAVVAVAEARK